MKSTSRSPLTVEEWIAQNRDMIDTHVKTVLGPSLAETLEEGPELNDEEREVWVANDEALYLMAKAAGADVP